MVLLTGGEPVDSTLDDANQHAALFGQSRRPQPATACRNALRHLQCPCRRVAPPNSHHMRLVGQGFPRSSLLASQAYPRARWPRARLQNDKRELQVSPWREPRSQAGLVAGTWRGVTGRRLCLRRSTIHPFVTFWPSGSPGRLESRLFLGNSQEACSMAGHSSFQDLPHCLSPSSSGPIRQPCRNHDVQKLSFLLHHTHCCPAATS